MTWRSPTRHEILSDPLFDAIWERIKSWDINVPEQYEGYCGANGNHVCAILDAVRERLNRQGSEHAPESSGGSAQCTCQGSKAGHDGHCVC